MEIQRVRGCYSNGHDFDNGKMKVKIKKFEKECPNCECDLEYTKKEIVHEVVMSKGTILEDVDSEHSPTRGLWESHIHGYIRIKKLRKRLIEDVYKKCIICIDCKHKITISDPTDCYPTHLLQDLNMQGKLETIKEGNFGPWRKAG